MIQGQFDAATRLDVAKPHDSTTAGEQERIGRPCKRRRISPPVEDSINVVDPSDIRRPKSPYRCESTETANPCVEQVSPAKNIVIRAAKTSQDGPVSRSTTQTEPNGFEEHEESCENPPSSNLDQVLLSGNSISTGGLLSNDIVLTTSSRTEIEAPGPPPNDNGLERESRQNGQAASVAASSSASSRRQSPAQESPSQGTRIGERIFRLPHGSKILYPLSPGHIASSDSSTPKPSNSGTQTNNTSSPLSSPPPELFDPYDEQSTEPPPSSSRPSSPVSDDEQQSSTGDEDGPTLYQERVHRSQTLRRSLSTLKGRELFDASIWADPLKTSVFYTFATNLRQKSKDAAPTGCHEFISHLSNAGKMVRCYTQNIDLLEDKVGLSTRLLLGPGSRSRFSTRLSKAASGTATPRNPNSTGSPSNTADAQCNSSQTTKEEDRLPAATSLVTDQETSSRLTTELEQQKEEPGRHEVTGDNNKPGRRTGQDQGREAAADEKLIDVPPVEAAPHNSNQPISKPESSQATPGHDRGVECVFLHGSLRSLRCFQCGCVADWDECNREDLTLSGEQPPCPRCEDATAARQERGKRALGVGKLRPDIVLYGEEHPESQRISTIIQHDISLAPDMLIIMGTSLKVHGLKTVVREFAKAVHNKKDGKVIFINFTKPAESVWADIIDFWIEMDCDAWVQDLKAKKPVIWLPPGSVDDEPRITKRRRATIKDEADKQSKKAKNLEQLRDVTQSTHTPTKDDKKKPAKELAEEKSDIKKPEPKRPACFRDCKQNGAHLTIKILSTLAKMSGRKEVPFLLPSPFEPMSAPQTNNSAAIPDSLATRPQQPSKARRGPRTKNTKSRKMPRGRSSTGPKTKTKPPKTAASSNGPDAGASDTPTAMVPPDKNEVAQSQVSLCPAPPAAMAGSESAAVNIGPVEASGATIVVEVPIPNLGTETGITGPVTSILASVKSNHRIRKPKKIFGEPASETSWTSKGSNSKSKSKSALQAKKTKSNAKTEKGKEGRQDLEADKNSAIYSNDPAHTLSALPACLQPISPRRQETPIQSYYILPPLQPANVRRPSKHNLPAIGLDPDSATHTARPPPDVLEPIIVPRPPVAISPTTLSPQHWRSRAFQYGDPLSGHFENNYLQGRPPQHADNSSLIQSSLAGQQQQRKEPYSAADPSPRLDRQYGVSDASPLVANPSRFDDIPSQQLDRESQAYEAAAALHDLSRQAGYDNRYFAIKPEGR